MLWRDDCMITKPRDDKSTLAAKLTYAGHLHTTDGADADDAR
jgi:hypothetical protein